jgi:hypothetical protein
MKYPHIAFTVSVAAALSIGAGACTTYRDQLGRGQRAYEQNDHDRTLAILRDLEPDVKRLSVQEQAQYAYLRGMSDYRIGYKPDARHWLSVAKAHEDNSPGVLPADWKARTIEALDELNGVVYSQGTSALPTSRSETTDDTKALASAPTERTESEVGAKDATKDRPRNRREPSEKKGVTSTPK